MVSRAGSETSAAVTALVLCGGGGTRMGGIDKGLVELAGRRLVDHVVERLSPQVENRFVLSCNRNADTYRALGFPVVTDAPELAGAGPLAGVAAGLQQVRTTHCLLCPCDTPLIPHDLVRRLRTALQQEDGEIAVVHDGQRRQPLHCLFDTALHGRLETYLRDGGHAVHAWLDVCAVVEADFSGQADAFRNVNTPEELAACAAGMEDGQACSD